MTIYQTNKAHNKYCDLNTPFSLCDSNHKMEECTESQNNTGSAFVQIDCIIEADTGLKDDGHWLEWKLLILPWTKNVF